MDKFEMNMTEKLQGNPEGLERDGYREAGEMAIEATEASLQEMTTLAARIESMERRHFRDATAEAKDDREILAAKEKLNELRAKLGLEPVELVVNREARVERPNFDLGGGMSKSNVAESEGAVDSPAHAGGHEWVDRPDRSEAIDDDGYRWVDRADRSATVDTDDYGEADRADRSAAVEDVAERAVDTGEHEATEPNWKETVRGEGLMATDGELDLNAPELMTRATMTAAATEYLVQQMQFDADLAREINEVSQQALAQAEEMPGDTTEALSAAEREKKIEEISDKLEGRHSKAFGQFARRAMSAAMAAVLAISLTGCALLGVNSEALKKGKISADAVQAVVNMGSGVTIEDGLKFEDMGDVTIDTRFEHTNGARYDYNQDYLRMSEKHGPNNFSVDKSEYYGDREGTIESMMGVFRNQPESLAAGVSAYKSVLQAAGLTGNETATEIDKMLSDEQGGGELQERLLKAFEAMLRDEESTSFEFYHEYNDERSYYMYNMKGNAGETNPSTMQLNLVEVQRNGEAQVMIKHSVYDAEGEVVWVEFGDFNMPCGYQLNREVKNPGTSTWVEIGEPDPGEPPTGNPNTPETGTPNTPGGPANPVDPDPGTSNNPIEPTPGKPGRPSTGNPIAPGEPGGTPEGQPPVINQPAGVTPKDPQNQINVVQNGGQTAKVEQSSGPGTSTESTTANTGSVPVISEGTTQTIINTAVDGTDAEAAAAAAAKAAEEKAAAEAAAAKAAAEKAAEEARQKADAEAAAEAARLEAAAKAAEEAAARAKAEAEAAAKAEAEAKAAAAAAQAAQNQANASEITGNMSDEDFNAALGDLGFN